MKFKHTFHVFVDNFSLIYKQLLYRLVVALIALTICMLGIYPYIRAQLNSPEFNELMHDFREFLDKLVAGDFTSFTNLSETIKEAFDKFVLFLNEKTGEILLCAFLLILIHLIATWFNGLANYATAAVINDKMALRANSHFMATLIKTLNKSTIFNLIYVPLSLLYDLIVGVAMVFLVYALVHSFLPLLVGVFLFVVIIIIAISVKMTFVCDWLPAVIRGKMKQGAAIKYTFKRIGKDTLGILSNFIIMILIVFGLNVAALLCTFGAGMLITVPASYVLIICFEFVNYYDREEIKYFIDKNTIIAPEKEKPTTREQFFRGEGD